MNEDHEIILKMIEEVSPEDTAKMDEIDSRVWCYLHGYKFAACKFDRIFVLDEYQCEIEKLNGVCFLKYTRSRDALKEIRPNGFDYGVDRDDLNPSIFVGFARQFDGKSWYGELFKGYCANEELAELHAIIQTIAFERSKK